MSATFYSLTTNSVQIKTGASNGFFLQSDASGNGSWAAAPTSSFSNGSAASPGITFTNDTTTGFFYSAGPATLGLTVSATNIWNATATAFSFVNGKTVNVGTSGTTSPLNVFGLITGANGLTISSGATSTQSLTVGGLLTANAGITSANGQTVSVGTSGATSSLNVFGLVTANNGMTVSGAVTTISKTGSTTLSTGSLYVNPAAFTTGGSAVYYSYFAGPSITTTAVTEAYTLYVNSPVASGTTITYPYSIYLNGGISYLNTGIRYKIASVATAAGTTVLAVTDYAIVFTGTTTQTVTLPAISAANTGVEYMIINTSTGSITVNTSGGATFIGTGSSIITNTLKYYVATNATVNAWIVH